MSKLDESRLILFNGLPQRVDIIESVLNTNSYVFINKYLSKIKKINAKDIKIVFKLLGEYNRNKQTSIDEINDYLYTKNYEKDDRDFDI